MRRLAPLAACLALTLAYGGSLAHSSTRQGARLGVLAIPRIGLVTPITQCGLDCFTQPWPAQLAHGPGHYPNTELPWQKGLVVLSGHRTTYTHPFRWINKLAAHDKIVWTAHHTHYIYRVIGMRIVTPQNFKALGLHPVRVRGGWSLEPISRNGHRLVLVACHPPHFATHRIAVLAKLVAIKPV
jgi:LPXTG-site transpeptidase (sortase) family protein